MFSTNNFTQKLYDRKDSSSYTQIIKRGQVLAIEGKTSSMNSVFLDKHNVFGALQIMSIRRSRLK